MTSPSAITDRPAHTVWTPQIILALLAVYVIWGSTYLAIRFALLSWPPLLMASTRFFAAGGLLLGYLRWRGTAWPTRAELRGAGLVGILLLCGGNGGVVLAEQWVSSSLSAALIATTPIWAVLLASLWGKRPMLVEWVGIFIGFSGVLLLNADGELRAYPLGALALMVASFSWALGSVLSQRVALPKGAMASAIEMLAAAPILLLGSFLRGEHMAGPMEPVALGAWVYLVVFGSLFGFGAYVYLLAHVRPAIATSYAYVNPVVALMLGTVFAGEHIAPLGLAGMGVALVGVAVIVLGRALWPATRTP